MRPLHRNIWCVGRNYADHAKELNNPLPSEPLIFLKSGDCINPSSLIRKPKWCSDLHYELELALWVNENLEISHFTLALDLTARDAQNKAKSKGEPWTLAKSFIGACVLGPWLSFEELTQRQSSLQDLRFELYINQNLKQVGTPKDMIFNFESLLSYFKEHFPLSPNDVILTGTPKGVGALQSLDKLEAKLYDTKDNKIQDSMSNSPAPLLNCYWDMD